MRGSQTHVVVRFPGMGTVLGALTAAHPGSVADAVLESARVEADGVTYTTVTMIRGIPEPQVDEAIGGLTKRYDSAPEIIERSRGATLVRTRLGGKDLAPALRVLARFQVDFAAPWSHIEAGTFSMRARVRFGGNAIVLADRMLAALESAGIAAEVEVREIGGRELAGWHELEEAMSAARPRASWRRAKALA